MDKQQDNQELINEANHYFEKVHATETLQKLFNMERTKAIVSKAYQDAITRVRSSIPSADAEALVKFIFDAYSFDLFLEDFQNTIKYNIFKVLTKATKDLGSVPNEMIRACIPVIFFQNVQNITDKMQDGLLEKLINALLEFLMDNGNNFHIEDLGNGITFISVEVSS